MKFVLKLGLVKKTNTRNVCYNLDTNYIVHISEQTVYTGCLFVGL
jgi:hypothetical protein